MVYLSWTPGAPGASTCLWRDPRTGHYGLQRFRGADGRLTSFVELVDSVKPKLINEHGTKVTLLGMSMDQDTTEAPPEITARSRWLAKYLNSRYFELPDFVTIRVREGFKTNNPQFRTVTGMKAYLAQHSTADGLVPLKAATAHWWVLDDGRDRQGNIHDSPINQNSNFIESAGHLGAIFEGEVYDSFTARAAFGPLQDFGIIFGARRVVIYVEPDRDLAITPNTARSQLLSNGEELPWEEWAADFRENLPAEIKAMMDELLSRDSDGDHRENIRQRLKKIEDLMRFTRYRRSSTGSVNASGDAAGGSAGEGDADGSTKAGKPGSRGGTAADLYGAYVDEDDGEPADPLKPQSSLPEIQWVSIAKGTRTPDDILEDRAASYANSTQNVLLINEDFRVYSDLVKHFVRLYEGYPGVEKTVPEVVKEWYAQQLVEAVIGVLAVRGSAKWPPNEVEDALSEVALTAVVMPRYNLYQQVSRVLGTKLGSLKDKAESVALTAA